MYTPSEEVSPTVLHLVTMRNCPVFVSSPAVSGDLHPGRMNTLWPQ